MGILISGIWLQGVAERFSIISTFKIGWLQLRISIFIWIVVGIGTAGLDPISTASKFSRHNIRIRTVPTWMRIPD